MYQQENNRKYSEIYAYISNVLDALLRIHHYRPRHSQSALGIMTTKPKALTDLTNACVSSSLLPSLPRNPCTNKHPSTFVQTRSKKRFPHHLLLKLKQLSEAIRIPFLQSRRTERQRACSSSIGRDGEFYEVHSGWDDEWCWIGDGSWR